MLAVRRAASISGLSGECHFRYVASPVRSRDRYSGRVVHALRANCCSRGGCFRDGHPGAPPLLRRWIEDNQDGIHVQSVRVPDDPRLAALDLGEREAIALAQQTLGSLPIIDDREGREEARRRGLRITGLLGVIRDAALRGYIDFDAAIQKLRNADFRLSADVEALVRRQYRERAG